MSEKYRASCDCGGVVFELSGPPKVRGFCHCEDCRSFLKVPYHSVDAYEKDNVEVLQGEDLIEVFQHPEKQMRRYFCSRCGDTLFNSNKADWRVVSQLLVRRSHDGELPEALKGQSHFFYGDRIVSIDDDLPKRE